MSHVLAALMPISIHALREEGDYCLTDGRWTTLISIHALREEGDLAEFRARVERTEFLSTPSARRATC